MARAVGLGDLGVSDIHGDAERVSPEAPVLVLAFRSDEYRLGGAASVAFLARHLGAEVTLCGVVGDDADGRRLRQLLAEAGIHQTLVFTDPDRPTTAKHRFVGRAGGRGPQQMLRLDREWRQPVALGVQLRLTRQLSGQLGHYDAVLVSDYHKGLCVPRLLAWVIQAAGQERVPVVVDPARIDDYSRYQGATVVKPNRPEAERATGRTIGTPQQALQAARDLRRRIEAEAVLVTLESDGMALACGDGSGELIPTTPRPVRDVTGAGDMVLAVLGLGLAAGLCFSESAQLANMAAGLEVQRWGVAALSPSEIREGLSPTGRTPSGKLVTLDRMVQLARSYRSAGRTIVLTNGCFDLLHAGHAACLEEAAKLGDVLVVALNTDRSVRRLKGPGRPVIGQQQRAALVAALGCVHHVLIFDEQTPHKVLRRLQPDVLVKGGTYSPQQVVGHEVVEAYGGKVCVTTKVEGISTTAILQCIRRQQTPGDQRT
ncbi:MAG TPA: bifunctional heptose 7-phosphate kinase/heptose 1-phosphate adenyltransferase [Planctomycetaceae bacterium]|nr:bifunctional heptose 7-phosphate kinase/heptose 1-phosphate adenyltransferase [Planctomycetaceae bacterium]